MILDAERKAFLTSNVMIALAACDDDLQSTIGRAVGARIEDGDGLDLVVSRWQWPFLVANVARRGKIAATFARPTDYVTYQVKGSALLREARPQDHALADRYLAAISETLTALGVPPSVMSPWFSSRDLVVMRIAIDAIFVQTPGASAGSRLEAAP